VPKGNASTFDSPQLRFAMRMPLPPFFSNYVGRKLFRFLLTIQGLGAFALITLGVMIKKIGVARRVIRPLIHFEISRAGLRLLPMFLFLAAVLGLLERNGEVRTKVIGDVRRATLHTEIRKNVAPGTEVFTDALESYNKMGADYAHQVIDHAECYAKGKVHTNGLENFWSLFKRCIKGTHVSVEPFHLFRYLDAQAFRYNNRKNSALGRFLQATVGIVGKRLTYDSLIGEADKDLPPAMA